MRQLNTNKMFQNETIIIKCFKRNNYSKKCFKTIICETIIYANKMFQNETIICE